MSTDSTELAFVRCPSCRSLVPAVSTRCRMCGATLDPSQKVEENTEPQKSGRVRQRTTATSSSDLSAAAGLIRKEMSSSADAPPMPVAAPENEAPLATGAAEPAVVEAPPADDDPLSAYIQEVDADTTSAAGANGHSESPTRATESSGPEAAGAGRPKVIVESGPRRNKPSGLSFGGSKGREEGGSRGDREKGSDTDWQAVGSKDSGTRENATRTAPHKQGSSQAPSSGSGSGRDARSERADRRYEQGEERRSDRVEHSQRPGRDQRDDRGGRGGSRQDQPRGDSLEFKQPGTGKLVGWLVSYVDPRGSALELREGRFFITGTALKPHDMVIEDATVSTPHAMVAAGLQDGLRVQDLMSDRGVWVKRRSQDGFQRIGDSVKLEHGDWIRFGEVEFLVCLLSGGATK